MMRSTVVSSTVISAAPMRATVLIAALLAAPLGSARAEADIAADTAADACRVTVADLRVRAAFLPANDLSRYVAERELESALRELIAGDVDDCEGMAEHAAQVIETRPYVLRPGEVLDGYGPDAPVLIGPPAAAPR